MMVSRRTRLGASIFIPFFFFFLLLRSFGPTAEYASSYTGWQHADKGDSNAALEHSIGEEVQTPNDLAADVSKSTSGDTTTLQPVAGVLDDEVENNMGSANSPSTTSIATPSSTSNTDQSLEDIDWSRFAYTQYVTTSDYLCNSVMLFETLHRLGSKADRAMMYPAFMMPDPTTTNAADLDTDVRLLIKARDEYDVKLVPIKVQRRFDQNSENLDMTWVESYTKLLAFNQTQYDRVLSLDSDGVILQTMDELFLIPPCPLAMPRAYWFLQESPPRRMFSSQVMLVQPSTVEFERILEKINVASQGQYDMEIVNDLYFDSAAVLSHRRYDMLSAEFRAENHAHYLGSDREVWDPVAALKEAKYVHFSDWPVPKPWIEMEEAVRLEQQPHCKDKEDGSLDCVDRELWNKLYEDFDENRSRVCPDSERRKSPG